MHPWGINEISSGGMGTSYKPNWHFVEKQAAGDQQNQLTTLFEFKTMYYYVLIYCLTLTMEQKNFLWTSLSTHFKL